MIEYNYTFLIKVFSLVIKLFFIGDKFDYNSLWEILIREQINQSIT